MMFKLGDGDKRDILDSIHSRTQHVHLSDPCVLNVFRSLASIFHIVNPKVVNEKPLVNNEPCEKVESERDPTS